MSSRQNALHSEHDANRALDRRQSISELVSYYQHQAKLAARGDTTRRSETFYLRQIQYFRLFGGTSRS
jgi:hypothetical protein